MTTETANTAAYTAAAARLRELAERADFRASMRGTGTASTRSLVIDATGGEELIDALMRHAKGLAYEFVVGRLDEAEVAHAWENALRKASLGLDVAGAPTADFE